MSDSEPTPAPSGLKQFQKPLIQAAMGLILLAVAGVAGGQIAGFRVEPEQCAQCRIDLATCQARDQLIGEALEKAEAALIKAYQECSP